MKQDFYDVDYFAHKKGGGDSETGVCIPIVKRFKKWGIQEFFSMGCGRGNLIAEARKQGIDAYGCDFSEYASEHANPEAKPYMFLQDITKRFNRLEVDIKKKFDWVLLYGVLEHLETEEQARQATENAVEILKLDGKIFCLICEGERDDEISHHLLRSRDWWFGFFSAYRLRDVSKCYFENMGETNIPKVAREELFILERV